MLGFIRAQGHPPEDAEDLVQEVFLRVYEDDVLARADQNRGRFRSFLLGVTRNVLRERARGDAALKRGGGRRPLSLDEIDALPSDSRDERFDRAWLESMVKEALARLRDECARDGRPFYDVLRMELDEELSHAEVAERTGRSLDDVRAVVSRGRRRLGELLAGVVKEVSSSPEEFEEEMAYLSGFVSRSE